MKLPEEKEKQIIDRFYGDGKGKPIFLDERTVEFSSRMEASLEKMDRLEEYAPPEDFFPKFDINAIIDEGMRRKQQQAHKEETRSFVISALIIVLSLMIWGNVIGWKTLLLWQWVLLLPASLALIPFMKKQNRKEAG